ncbi:DUF4131 domain-containing protein [Streptomyces sp. SCUT-3]|uniref:ComEC/Rec2 family competence protein n=1 Tax=Streptomyces sp. SCUT-3 TaxID=2684469 RepID=UPI0015FC08A2|nr:ComEC/Rec2 family competence protein [Streptomyces sp. SCUT-3]QMV23459.1 DUF4131 domain-containing protein [Streptomyces sp. SCUT-3]
MTRRADPASVTPAPSRRRSPPRRQASLRAPSRLGDPNPRAVGPADLRLVPLASAAWGAAALTLSLPRTTALLLPAGCAALAAVLAAALLAVRRTEAARAAAAVLLCAACAAAVATAHAADLRRGPLPAAAAEHRTVTVGLTVTSDPRTTRPRVSGPQQFPPSVVFEARAERVAVSGGPATRVRTPVLVLVRTREARSAPWLSLLPSTRLTVTATAVPPLGPGDRAAAVLRVGDGPPHVTDGPNAAQRTAGTLRAGLRDVTDGLSPDARALLPGLVVGDTSRVPADLADAFRATDLSHLLAVSGANLTIVLILLIGPPGRAVRAERGGLAPLLGLSLRATAVLGGLLTVGFVVLCRPDPSVLRAAACGLITLLAIGTGRRRALLPALAGAVLLLVLYDPWLARSYGFLLSVLATASLLLVAPRWAEALRGRGVPARLAEVLAAAGAAQAACAPVVAVIAAQVSLVAVPCNLFAELAVAPATVLGFAALATAPFAEPPARFLARVAAEPVEWIAAVARAGAGLPGATVDWPGGWAGGALLAAAAAAVCLVARRVVLRPWLCAALAVALLLVVVRPSPLPRIVTGWPPPDWRVVACDVGQGDAIVLAAGPGRAVVVDAGPDPAPVDRCLRSLEVTAVPLVVVTHFHADHVAGLAGVLRGREVGAVETTVPAGPPGQRRAVRRLAASAGVPLLRAAAGERRRVGDLSWEVLAPGPSAAAEAPYGNPNDSSVVMLVRTAGLTVLLLGDVEPPAQRSLLEAVPDLPRVDVLKVAHHGSAHQDGELLRRVAPRLALVSCGRDNDYGHPSPRTLAALRAVGTTVLRTDLHGSVAVTGTPSDLRAARAGPR